MYLDSNGLITQKPAAPGQVGDGGDKLQREGFWFAGWQLNPNYPVIAGMAPYSVALTILTYDAQGDLERDEIQYTQALDPDDVSRDQLSPNVNACGLYEFTSRVTRIFTDLISNYSRYPNNDLAFLNDYGRIMRAYNKWYFYPLILFCDIYFMLSSMVTVGITWFDWSDAYAGNDLNLICDLATYQVRQPTPFAWMARKFFKFLRRGGAMHGLNVYFNPATGANPEFIDLWQPTVENF